MTLLATLAESSDITASQMVKVPVCAAAVVVPHSKGMPGSNMPTDEHLLRTWACSTDSRHCSSIRSRTGNAM